MPPDPAKPPVVPDDDWPNWSPAVQRSMYLFEKGLAERYAAEVARLIRGLQAANREIQRLNIQRLNKEKTDAT